MRLKPVESRHFLVSRQKPVLVGTSGSEKRQKVIRIRDSTVRGSRFDMVVASNEQLEFVGRKGIAVGESLDLGKGAYGSRERNEG